MMSDKYPGDAEYYRGEGLDPDADFNQDFEEHYHCAAFTYNGKWHCPLVGSEECDWECSEGGAGWWFEEDNTAGKE